MQRKDYHQSKISTCLACSKKEIFGIDNFVDFDANVERYSILGAPTNESREPVRDRRF